MQLLKKKAIQIQITSSILNIPIEELVSNEPTEWLIILNASYDSKITGGELLKVFSSMKGFVKVEMLLTRGPFSFVLFNEKENAQSAMEALDGIKSPVLGKVLLLQYTKIQPPLPPRPFKQSREFEQVPGLTFIPEFITEEDEMFLLEQVNLLGSQRWEKLNQRDVQHFGYRFDYPINDVDRTPIDIDLDQNAILPTWCDNLLSSYVEQFPMFERPNQLTVNRYKPGDGIAFHCDRHSSFKSPVLIVSLGSDIVMDFRSLKGDKVSCVLARRSLLVIDGEARYGWEHVIRPRKIDVIDGLVVERGERSSLTFRTTRLRSEPCTCAYPQLCD